MDSKFLNNDFDLILRLRKGDKKAFEIIFNQYKSKLYFFALSYLKSDTEAEEIIQNVFISLWESRKTLNESLSIKNYLFKITVNKVYNFFKQKTVRQKYIDYILTYSFNEDDYSQKNIYYNDLKRTVDSLVEKLPLSQKKIFKMSRWEGISYNEIAQKLGLSVRSVENQVYRALKFLKENLEVENVLG